MKNSQSSVDTTEEIHQKLKLAGINLSDDSSRCVATGYGRISVPYADKTVTEITCHALGAVHLFQQSDLTVIDIGDQDTKIIQIEQGFVKDFIMNDNCAAQVSRMNGEMSTFCLTGGLCECDYIREALSKELGKEVISCSDARYAGAIGAALSAMKIRR